MKANAVSPETKVVKAEPTALKEPKSADGKFANVVVKPVEFNCSTTDWVRYGAAVCGFSTLGCLTGAALPLLAACVQGSLSAVGIGCLTSLGTIPGFAGIISSSIYIAATPTK